MKTIIQSYRFYTDDPKDAAAYKQLVEKFSALNTQCFRTWGGSSHYFPQFETPTEIELETKFIFNNQWNTTPIPGISDKGLRVFDWAEDYPINFSDSIKRGHYLIITPAMRNIRHNTVACGYCGRQERLTPTTPVFCHHCMNSAYLKKEYLHLLRFRRIDDPTDRPKLTEEEHSYLNLLYTDAQTQLNSKRAAAKRSKVHETYIKKTESALRERDGFLWLLNNNINTENVIYYDCTQKFCFGWRTPVSPKFAAAISGFPFPHEIKSEK